jgi:hypothetical protein
MLFWRTTESIVAPATVSSSAQSNSARRRPKKPRPSVAKVFASALIFSSGAPREGFGKGDIMDERHRARHPAEGGF